MKSKKLELKKEVIASLTNDAMANVWGGDLVKNTIGCISPSQGGGCGSGNCIPYTQDPNKCPLTEFNTCDCVVPNTKICVKLTYHCVLDGYLSVGLFCDTFQFIEAGIFL